MLFIGKPRGRSKMISNPPFSKMTSEATCDNTSELDLTKSSSEFFTLASPHTTQLISSEDCPKGLSPTLFGIFVADLVHELRAKFLHTVIYLGRHPPHPHTLGPSTTHIWIGGLLYVDDLALMSTCPRELQAMLHICRQWSIRNRMHMNTHRRKIMAFFETPALLRAWGGQHQPGPTMPSFHVYSPFQPPAIAYTLCTKSSNMSTFALFWTLFPIFFEIGHPKFPVFFHFF